MNIVETPEPDYKTLYERERIDRLFIEMEAIKLRYDAINKEFNELVKKEDNTKCNKMTN